MLEKPSSKKYERAFPTERKPPAFLSNQRISLLTGSVAIATRPPRAMFRVSSASIKGEYDRASAPVSSHNLKAPRVAVAKASCHPHKRNTSSPLEMPNRNTPRYRGTEDARCAHSHEIGVPIRATAAASKHCHDMSRPHPRLYLNRLLVLHIHCIARGVRRITTPPPRKRQRLTERLCRPHVC